MATAEMTNGTENKPKAPVLNIKLTPALDDAVSFVAETTTKSGSKAAVLRAALAAYLATNVPEDVAAALEGYSKDLASLADEGEETAEGK